ncbi:hypothetical protein Patl1_35681 [Pistacia atlantica]|nr:hypothetical protein Patl1_35681 [Pistacia atlantica]
MRVPRKCSPEFYESHVLPVLNKKHAEAPTICFFFLAGVQLTKFDYRLSNNLDSDMQKLRCRVNYHALRFTDSILETSNLLVERMRMKNKHFIALEVKLLLFCLNRYACILWMLLWWRRERKDKTWCYTETVEKFTREASIVSQGKY